ncbi:MAG: hypothetical protein ACOY30_05370 [Bacillota bacterium]
MPKYVRPVIREYGSFMVAAFMPDTPIITFHLMVVAIAAYAVRKLPQQAAGGPPGGSGGRSDQRIILPAALSLPQALGLELPNPNNAIEALFKPLSDWLE